MIKIAVLLTVFNRREVTLNGLRALHKSITLYVNRAIFDIYMVDDGCTDGTSDAVIKEFPNVRIIKGNGALYWNRGMIDAWKTALKNDKYQAFLWFNDDVIVKETSLSVLIKCAEKHQWKSIIVGSMCDINDSTKVTYGGRNFSKKIITPDKDNEKPCVTFNGNLVLIPIAVYERIGMNNNRYAHALGDLDYGYRANKAGVSAYIVPGFIGYCSRHDKPAIWCDPKRSIKQRIKNYYSPTGNHPREVFYFEKEHFGIIMALFHLLSNHVRLLFPYFWSNKNV